MTGNTENTKTSYYNSPIGLIEIEANDTQLLRIEFVDKESSATSENKVLKETINQLTEYFSGDLSAFNLPLKIDATEFQKEVWMSLTKIPIGKTTSYGQLASSLNKPNASRAVGAAAGKNVFAIVIPCHRMKAANNKLIGYKWGLNKKQWLLEHEAKVTNQLLQLF